jgi:hypothetical protein
MSDLLQKWIEQGEHLEQDFKFRIDSAAKIAISISAFCNTSGGRLLIGVKDNGNISGVNPEEEAYMIESAAEVFTAPVPDYKLEILQSKEKKVLVATFQSDSSKIFKAKDESGQWLTYMRIQDQNVLMPPLLQCVRATPKTSLPSGYRHSGNDLKILEWIECSDSTNLNKIQKHIRLPRHLLIRKLAAFISWGLIELKFEAGQWLIHSAEKK